MEGGGIDDVGGDTRGFRESSLFLFFFFTDLFCSVYQIPVGIPVY